MRRFSSTPALLSVALVFASACSGGGGLGLGPTTPKVNIEGVEFASFSLVNAEREGLGEATVSRNDKVAKVAREYSEKMRDEGFFSHVAPDGLTLRQRLESAGVEFASAAENLAKVTNSADPAAFAHTLLMAQPKHRENILDPEYELLGVGATKLDGTVWITQIFIHR